MYILKLQPSELYTFIPVFPRKHLGENKSYCVWHEGQKLIEWFAKKSSPEIR